MLMRPQLQGTWDNCIAEHTGQVSICSYCDCPSNTGLFLEMQQYQTCLMFSIVQKQFLIHLDFQRPLCGSLIVCDLVRAHVRARAVSRRTCPPYCMALRCECTLRRQRAHAMKTNGPAATQ